MSSQKRPSEFPVIQAALLGAVLTYGACNGLRGHPYEARQEPPTQSSPDAASTPVGTEIDKVTTDVLRLFSSTPTPEEEAAICNEILAVADDIDAQADPISFIETINSNHDCRREVSKEAKSYLEAGSSELEKKYYHLMRCTPQGQDFALEDLELCEQTEYEYAADIETFVTKWDLDYEFHDFEAFTPWEFDRGTDLMTPGPTFIIESADGAFETVFKFNVTQGRDEFLHVDPDFSTTTFDGSPDTLKNVYRPSGNEDKYRAASRFFRAAKKVQAIGTEEEATE